MPSPPKTRETKIQFSEPIIFTTMPAIVRINVPFIRDSPFVDLFSSSIAVTTLLFAKKPVYYIINTEK